MPIKRNPWDFVATAGLVAALILLWFPFLALCTYAYPALDDFTESIWTDFWELQKQRYFSYTGRFVGTLLQSLNPWHWESLSAYRISAGLRIVFFLMCTHVFFRVINRFFLAANNREFLLLQVLFWGSFLAGLTSPSEFFYWHAASIIYLNPLAVLLLSSALLIYELQTRRHVGAYSIAYGSGFFYVSGNVEMLPLLVFSTTALLLIYGYLRSSTLVRPLAIVLVATFAGLCVNLLAPGNEARELQMDAASRSDDVLAFATMLLLRTFKSCARWSLNEYVMVPALLAAPVFWKLGQRGLRLPNPLLVAAITFYCLVVLYSAPLWGLGFTVGRVENLCFFVYLSGLYAFIASVAVNLKDFLSSKHLVGIWISSLCVALLAAGFVQFPEENKVVLAYRELSNGIARSYQQAERRRAYQTKNFVGDNVVVPPLGVVAHSLVPKVIVLGNGREDVLAEDPADWWANNAYARYYGKQSLRVMP